MTKISALRARSPAQLTADLNRYLPTAVAWLLVLVIGWHAAQLLWAVLPSEPEFDWSERAPVASAGVGTAFVDFRAIAGAHLFGEAGKEPAPTVATTAPDTRLNLKLKGTIAADDQTIAHAIITDGNGKSNVYFVEDSVPGGANLFEVYPDRVILKRGAALETLRLPKTSLALGSQAAQLRTEDSDSHGSAAGSRAPSAVREMMQSNPSSFTEIVRPQPYMPNGQMQGYRVYPGRDRRAFAALGLRPGDLVTEINGQALDDMQNSMEVFRNLGQASELTVTVERNGTRMLLTLDESQFDSASGASQ